MEKEQRREDTRKPQLVPHQQKPGAAVCMLADRLGRSEQRGWGSCHAQVNWRRG